MDKARPSNPNNIVSLQEAAQRLAVSVAVLLQWNEQNILKPIITPTGEIAYTEEQITNFLQIYSSREQQKAVFSSDNI